LKTSLKKTSRGRVSRPSKKFLILCFLFFIPHLTRAENRPSLKKLTQFFDLDKNGVLNTYENSLIRTQLHFNWPLANTKTKKKFDYNKDYMLEPYEEAQYEKEISKHKIQFRGINKR